MRIVSARKRNWRKPAAVAIAIGGVMTAGLMAHKDMICEEGMTVKGTEPAMEPGGLLSTRYFVEECHGNGIRKSILKSSVRMTTISSRDGTSVAETKGKIEEVQRKENNARPFPKISEDALVERLRSKKVIVFGEDHMDTRDGSKTGPDPCGI